MNRFDFAVLLIALGLCAACIAVVKHVAMGRDPWIPKAAVVDLTPADITGTSRDYRGNPKAPFTLVEFADYQCPACESAHPRVREALARNPGELKYLFRHFPLPGHNLAEPAAEAASAAGLQGHFWEMHDLLMESHGNLNEASLLSGVRQLHLDASRFLADRSSAARKRVMTDRAAAERVGVTYTPTFFLCCPDRKVIKLGRLEDLGSYLAPH